MNILILGGSGYLGKKIVTKLCEVNSDDLVVASCRELERFDNINYSNLRLIDSNSQSIYHQIDTINIDIIINCVCNYGRKDTLYDEVIDSNVVYPLEILNYALQNGNLKKFITIGTGLPDDFNMYTFSKKQFNEFGAFYAKKHKIDFYVLKLEMFYGYDEPLNRFIPSTILNMLKGNEINVTKGLQKRDIICSDDIVNVIPDIINCNLEGYNEIDIGTGIAPSISDLIDFIAEQTNTHSVINKGIIPTRENEPDSVANIEVLNSICDFKPLYWQDGITQMIEKIKERIGENQ